jgi:hypothetical protein
MSDINSLPTTVAVRYRPKSLQGLLESLSIADYSKGKEIRLIIKIDKSEPDQVLKVEKDLN